MNVMNPGAPRDRGFTMLELLVALGLTLAVAAGASAISLASPDLCAVQNETVDMPQRIRAAADGLFHDLLGAWAVRPYRSDGSSPDPPGSFKTGTITALGAVV